VAAATTPGTALAGSRYELLTRIGSGGMATVHLGRRRGDGTSRLVAIKRMHPHLAGDTIVRRAMIGEARIASRLHHPNVVAVHDVDDLGAELLLVMDYVEGASLSSLVAARPLPRAVATRIVLDAAAGLAAAHALIAVHRDVTPDNLLVGVDGVTRLIDFGVAKCAGLTENLTQMGVLKGKFAYMAPEYLLGCAIDARADVFALGVVAWELLAGRRLFKAGTASATMHRVARMEAPRLSTVAAGFGVAFDAVLERALTKDPALRFPTVAAFAEAFAAAASWPGGIASRVHVGATVQMFAGEELAKLRAKVGEQLAQLPAPPSRPKPPPLPPIGRRASSTPTLSPSESIARRRPGAAPAAPPLPPPRPRPQAASAV